MKRMGQVVVLILVIGSLFAPASLQCAPLAQPDHSCCASQTQLSAPSCCQHDASPNSAAPAQATDQANGEFAGTAQPAPWIEPQRPALSQLPSSIPPPILLPATILRT